MTLSTDPETLLRDYAKGLEIAACGMTLEASEKLAVPTPVQCADAMLNAADIMADLAREVIALREALEAVELARNTDAPADWERATKLTDAALNQGGVAMTREAANTGFNAVMVIVLGLLVVVVANGVATALSGFAASQVSQSRLFEHQSLSQEAAR